MNLKSRSMVGAVTIGLAAAVAGGVSGSRDLPSARGADDQPARKRAEDPSGPTTRPQYDAQQNQKTVEFWERREKKDPQGAIARSNLAGAYLARQRETGLIEDAVRAERAARASLEIRPSSNVAALNKLATALLTQHRFPEALLVADQALARDLEAQRLRADILLEMGDYEAARRALSQIPAREEDLNLMAASRVSRSSRSKMARSNCCKTRAGSLLICRRRPSRGIFYDGGSSADRYRKTR